MVTPTILLLLDGTVLDCSGKWRTRLKLACSRGSTQLKIVNARLELTAGARADPKKLFDRRQKNFSINYIRYFSIVEKLSSDIEKYPRTFRLIEKYPTTLK